MTYTVNVGINFWIILTVFYCWKPILLSCPLDPDIAKKRFRSDQNYNACNWWWIDLLLIYTQPSFSSLCHLFPLAGSTFIQINFYVSETDWVETILTKKWLLGLSKRCQHTLKKKPFCQIDFDIQKHLFKCSERLPSQLNSGVFKFNPLFFFKLIIILCFRTATIFGSRMIFDNMTDTKL